MANTFKFGNENWAVKDGKVLAYNDENNAFKPLPFTFARSSSATRVDNEGLIKSTDSGFARIDFLNNTSGHLLLEPQSTNKVTVSEDFSNSVWVKSNSTVSLSSISTPNGDLNSYKLLESDTNSSHHITFGNSSTSDMSFSVFAKSAERTFVQLQAAGVGNTDCVFDLSNGTILIEEANATANIKDYGNGWYRCSVSYSASGTNNSVIKLYNGGDSYQGDGSSGLYIWGAQLEELSYPTSYIATTGSAVTRAAETCNSAGNSTVFDSTEGVFYAEISALASDSTAKEITLSDGTTNNRIIISYNTANQIRINYRKASSNIFDQTKTITITESNKVAVKYKLNDFSFFVNGTKVASSTSGSVMSANTLTQLNFDDGSGSFDFYGKIKNVQVYNTALTDAELIELTS